LILFPSLVNHLWLRISNRSVLWLVLHVSRGRLVVLRRVAGRALNVNGAVFSPRTTRFGYAKRPSMKEFVFVVAQGQEGACFYSQKIVRMGT
jgi:hypothetical protein